MTAPHVREILPPRSRALVFLSALFAAAFSHGAPRQAQLTVPAYTAYIDPHPNGASVSEQTGITHWNGAADRVLWFGQFKSASVVDCTLRLRLPVRASSKLRLMAAGQSRDAEAIGAGTDPITVSFGTFEIKEPGYVRFELQSLNHERAPNGDLDALILAGPVLHDAHFNLKPRRNAASVHLHYLIPADAKIDAFYCEATGITDPVGTYYMACGWHRGYFGMQVNSPAERRIIFSVWDAGREAVDRNKVADADRVTLIAKGEGVFAGDFGHEGTGGHSHLVFPWKTGESQRFMVTAKIVDAAHTIYSGYWFHPEKKQWMLISSWKAPQDGKYLHGLYSFNEDFDGGNGHLQRKASFTNQWIHLAKGTWSPITRATFTHDPTGAADRLDRFMDVAQGRFLLSNGGFVDGFTPSGKSFDRSAEGKPPEDVKSIIADAD